MDSEFSPPLTVKRAGLEARRDEAIASALRKVYGRLQPSSCTAYLLAADAELLVAAMTVHTPLSFAITPQFRVDNLAWPAVRAFQTGKAVRVEAEDLQSLCRRTPALLVTTPFPMVIVVAPIRTTPQNRLGVITLRCVPPREISEGELDYVQTTADELAADLQSLVEQGLPLEGPSIPLFISSQPEPQAVGAASGAVQQHRQATSSASTPGSPFLYQLQRLATELTAAVDTKGILAVVRTQILRPFGAKAVALCLAEGERLHVAGTAGLSREVLHRIEGTPLSHHSPETDTITGVGVKIFTSVSEIWQEYPGLGIDLERQARAYLPLISNGRAVGCCLLEFTELGRPLSAEEIAVLMIMLEQVGQSLERARAYEREHALTQTIQRSLLPRSFPHLPEVVATGRYFTATEGAAVGGDWYDVLTLPNGGVGLVIGDVEGHSLEAVSVMGQLRSGVRAYTAEGHDPARVLERSNRLLADLDTDLYATCCCVWLDSATGLALASTAGHPGPVISDSQGQIVEPRLSIGPPLGVGRQTAYQQTEFQMQTGSVVALFTNGLLDSRRLGTDAAVRQLARRLADRCSQNLEVLADSLASHRCPPAVCRDDDAALLLVRYEGVQPRDRPRVARTSIQRHDLRGVAGVRRFLRDVLREWNRLPLLDDLELLVSEVVTNGLIHAHSEVDLRLREYPDRIRVEARDSDPYPPVPTVLLNDESSNQEAESGRGLLIVEALALAWGSSPAGRGKTTWFEVSTAAAPAPEIDQPPSLPGRFPPAAEQ
ncbi:SpoIIE family protein phosphatase [Streptomyces sp. NPDC004609]|uniref:SpoIIE family protein phosphatase n=1 Tax=Streptomyces sp. NPDC004609 TaxID=3364704 RepID=UPI0036A1EC84